MYDLADWASTEVSSVVDASNNALLADSIQENIHLVLLLGDVLGLFLLFPGLIIFLLLLALILIVRAGIISLTSLENLGSNSADHNEPDDGDDLEEEEQSEEDISDTWGPVGVVDVVPEWLQEELVNWDNLNFTHWDGVSLPWEVSSEADNVWNIVVNGPANHHVENVTSNEPDNHEQSEHNVANGLITEVFQHFGGL